MTRTLTFTSAAALLAAVGTTAIAQETVFGTGAATATNEDLRDSISDDFTREVDTFSNRGRALGFDGSVAVRGSVSSGNSDVTNIGIGADLGYFDGVNGYGLELAYSYSEAGGTVDENSITYDFEYRRDFSSAFFGFAKLQGSADEIDAGDLLSDTYVGFGAGYRIYDTNDVQWTVQAGPGYRVSSFDGLASGDADVEEGAFAVSSNYFNRLQPGTVLSMDTDVIASESDTVVFNKLALTQNVSDQLALRTSLDTEFHTDPAAGRDDTDNTFGVSLVYSFN